MRTAFESEGDVRSVDLLAAFATLWRQRATGVLTFSQPGPHVRFEIIEGDVVGVFSSDPIFDTAEVLIRAGKLDPTALEGRLPAGRDRARAARELGLVTERDWRWAEKIRAVEILSDILDWLEGSYAWDVSRRPESGELRIGIERLLLELFLRSRDRELIHRSLGAADAPLQRSADFDEKFPELGLTAEALAVAEAIDGRATAAEISRRAPPDPFSVEKLLAALATLGLVHPEYAAEAPPAPSAAWRTASPPPAPEPATEVEPEAERELVASELPGPAAGVPREESPPTEAPVELPLAPGPEPAEPEPVLTSWEPAPAEPMDQSLDLPEPPVLLRSHRPSLTGVWLLVVLAVAVGALLLFRAWQAGNPPATSALPAATTPTASAALAATVPPTALPPTAAPPTEISAIRTPTTRPTPASTAAPRPTATAVAIGAPPRTVADPGRRQWLARAERDRTLLQRDRHAPYTIQLELVCELSSLEEAWKFDRRGAMRLLTASHRGRECFRVFWGRYATLDEARAAKASVPRFFFTATNQPAVVSTRSALLR